MSSTIPAAICRSILDITDANVNDAQIGRQIEIEAGLTYVFDKGYCHYGWWRAIHAAEAFFVTRPKTNMGLTVKAERQYRALARRRLHRDRRPGGRVLEQRRLQAADPAAPHRNPARRGRQDDLVITNDMKRSAVEIAQAYKFRWQIELLFRWLKQHLKLRTFLGTSPNAVKLQIYAAMIAYILLRLAAKAAKTKLDILRFAELVGLFLFDRRRLAAIDTPPPTNPSRKRDQSNPNQMAFHYA